MAFAKKWSDEQNNQILKLWKEGKSQDEIAKEFGTTSSTIKSRIGYLNHKLKKKLKKISKKAPEKKIKKTKEIKPKKIKDDVELSTAEIKNEAEDMADLYKGKDINLDEKIPKEEFKQIIQEPKIKEVQEVEDDEVDWSGVPEQFIEMINDRFIAFNKKENTEVLKPLTQSQKEQGAKATYQVLNKRGKVFMKYADLIGLGAFLFGAILPNVLAALSYQKKKNIIQEPVKPKEPILKEIKPKEPSVDDLNQAQREYEKALQEGK